MELVFATHNEAKFKEVQKLVPQSIDLLSLNSINCNEDIEETGTTLQENAKIKASYIFNTYGYNCFSDDTGLLVNALNGAPGVYSARYAGEEKNADNNMDKLLLNLKDKTDRSAYFETSICLILNNKEYFFTGKVEGEIIQKKTGSKGFGYDPIFKPHGYEKTFAEIPLSEKNKISHRSKAITQLISFLNSLKI